MKKVVISAKALQDLFGCTAQYIVQLCDKGVVQRISLGKYDLLPSVQNYVKMLRKNNQMGEGSASADPSQMTLEEAKRQKAIKEVEKLDLQNARERGDLIAKSSVRDKCIKAGAILVAELAAIENDMPGQIEGAKAALIRDRLNSRFTIMLERYREQLKSAEEEDRQPLNEV